MIDATPGYLLIPEPPTAPLTARNLEDFRECPRKYLLSFFSTRARTGQFIGGSAALHRAVRAAMIAAYAAGGPERHPLTDLLATFEQAWEGGACADSREELDLHRDGVAMLRRLHECPPALAGTASEVSGSAGYQVDVHLQGHLAGHEFVATADVVVPPAAAVVRFTTARRPPSPGELPHDLSWGLMVALGRQQLQVARVVGTMVDLRKGRAVHFELDAAAQAQLEATVGFLADRIRREREFTPVPGKLCRWCRSRPDCPATGAGGKPA